MGAFLLRILLIFVAGFFIGCAAENIADKEYFGFGVNLSIGITMLASYITNYII